MASKTLHDTKLWKILIEKNKSHEDIASIEKACEEAQVLLDRIPDTFPTYTLHNYVHSLNVCDLMADLLGDEGLAMLSSLEAAFLILAAYYHDSGMVYTPDEKDDLLNRQEFVNFRKQYPYADIEIKKNNGEVSDDIAAWYFRTIHPTRMGKIPDFVIEGKISVKPILARLCESHGVSAAKIASYSELTGFDSDETDFVFCAVLLRLADILDFDQTRSPQVLFEYLRLNDATTGDEKKSKQEFLKHLGSLGFRFPADKRLSGYELPFSARCDRMEVEQDIRAFLDVIDRELNACAVLQRERKSKWDNLSLPGIIKRDESYGIDYQYGEYWFALDHDKAIELFTGDNLYPNKTVFVRELLQNAIDATLHRQKHEKRYKPYEEYKPEVKITTWVDDEHYKWFRIDDNGMGMDERKVREYFLKAGKSYYESEEFKDEAREFAKHKEIGGFTPISRFGIGVLSCFLAGDMVDLSTRTDKDKSSVRLRMEKGVKYYKTQLEGKIGQEHADEMPAKVGESKAGYRHRQGTSIAVRVAPYQHFVELDFEKIVKEYLLYPPVPVLFNGMQVMPTEEEFLAGVEKAKAEPIKIEIPQDVIDWAKREHRLTIHEGAYVEISLKNLGDYVTEPNKHLLKGVLFFVDAYLDFTDDFVVANKEHIDKISDLDFKAGVKLRIINHRLYIQIGRSNYIWSDIQLSQCEQEFMMGYDTFQRSLVLVHDMNVDLRCVGVDWYEKYVACCVQEDHEEDIDNIYYDSRLYSSIVHNGVICYSGLIPSFNDNVPYDGLLIALCHDSYRPILTIARDKVQLLPPEMLSGVNLAISKAINELMSLYKRKNWLSYCDFIILPFDEESHSITNFSPSITANELCELSDLSVTGGWSEYLGLSEEIDSINIYRILRPDSLIDAIYASLIQTLYEGRIQLTRKQDGGYELHDESECIVTPEHIRIANAYYPPFAFLQVKNVKSLFVQITSYVRWLINLNHADSTWLLNNTETLKSKYPALFHALLNELYRRDEDDRKLNEIFRAIKALPQLQS